MSSKGERPPKRQRSAPRTTGQDASSARPLKSRIRVLIADDHGVVREGLVSMIQRNKADMTLVGEAPATAAKPSNSGRSIDPM